MMNTLSAIFVHCLKKDGSFSDPKKSKFHNFFPYFSPHAIPPNFFALSGGYFDQRNSHSSSLTNPQHFPFQGIASQTTFPLIFSRIPPTSTPSKGILREDFREKVLIYHWILTIFEMILADFGRCLGDFLGAIPREFIAPFAKKSALMGRILGKMTGRWQRCLLRRNPPEREKIRAGPGG
jgi:hypothetical protein